MAWYGKTAHELIEAVSQRQASAVEIAESYLGRIEAVEPRVDAFTQVWRDSALEQAARVDARIARGENAGPLAGVPVALKELLCTVEGETTCASRILAGFRSPYDATAVQRLK
ncbi:MAG TPA: amidase family protein, partial [Candidatus Hydrogenedentes bacterium]|nr:amidase family protein [Candidatus Hydrogenedentota bacterium]